MATSKEKQKQIDALQRLGLTDDEIAEVLADDEKIDKGEKLFELSAEQKENVKKMTKAGNCKGYTKSTEKKEKPIDENKRNFISTIAETLENLADSGTVDIINPERELTFTANGKKYKIVLSCPRS